MSDTDFTSHRHGGHPEQDARRLGVDVQQVLDFSVNVSPLGPPERLLDAWSSFKTEIRHYPADHGSGLTDHYRERYDLPPDQILPGNGVSELIYLLVRALTPDRALMLAPSFHDYERAARAVSTEPVFHSILRDGKPQPPEPETLAHDLRNADICLIGYPNNPTGRLCDRAELLDLIDAHPTVRFVLDEAFIRFVDDPPSRTLIHEVPERSNLVVFRSLTKFYAIPGLRAGAMIAPPDLVEACRSIRAPWMINQIADRVAPLLNGVDAYDRTLRELVRSERERMLTAVNSLPDVRAFSSQANFLLARRTDRMNLDALLTHLLERGLYVRDARNFRGLDGPWFRFAIRNEADNNRLIDALESVP